MSHGFARVLPEQECKRERARVGSATVFWVQYWQHLRQSAGIFSCGDQLLLLGSLVGSQVIAKSSTATACITKGVYCRSSQTVARRLKSANNSNCRQSHSHAESGYLSLTGTKLCEPSEIGAVLTEFDEGEYFNTVAQWLDMFERGNHTDSSKGQGHRPQIRRALLASDGDAEEEVGGFDGESHFAHPKLSDKTSRSIEENASRSRKSRSFDREMRARCTGRRLMLTTEDKMVMGPAHSQSGDLVVWLDGVLAPFALRKAPLAGELPSCQWDIPQQRLDTRSPVLCSRVDGWPCSITRTPASSISAILEDLCRPCTLLIGCRPYLIEPCADIMHAKQVLERVNSALRHPD